jgi:hypothetical protein
MNVHALNRKKIRAVFFELYQRCDQRYTYSVIEAARAMGIDYKHIESWAQSDEWCDNLLQLCRQRCSVNAERDCLYAIIPLEDGLQYLFECDDDWRTLYPTDEARQALTTSCIKKY